jgi:hypothetical protein
VKLKEFLHKHPHIAHNAHGALHVAYFTGVCISNLGKFYGLTAGFLAVIGLVAMIKGSDP